MFSGSRVTNNFIIIDDSCVFYAFVGSLEILPLNRTDGKISKHFHHFQKKIQSWPEAICVTLLYRHVFFVGLVSLAWFGLVGLLVLVVVVVVVVAFWLLDVTPARGQNERYPTFREPSARCSGSKEMRFRLPIFFHKKKAPVFISYQNPQKQRMVFIVFQQNDFFVDAFLL